MVSNFRGSEPTRLGLKVPRKVGGPRRRPLQNLALLEHFVVTPSAGRSVGDLRRLLFDCRGSDQSEDQDGSHVPIIITFVIRPS
jgi:hypothetical protein